MEDKSSRSGQSAVESLAPEFEWTDVAVAPPERAEPVPAPGPAVEEPAAHWDPRYDRRRTPRARHTDRRHAPRSPRAHLFVTICHWSMVLLLALSLLTGMRLGWGYNESALGGAEGTRGAILQTVSPKGTLFGVNLITLHVTLAFATLAVVAVYVGYLIRSRASRRLVLTGQDALKLIRGLTRDFLKNKGALWSANLLVYWIAFAMIGVLVITGLALYRLDLGLSSALGGYDLVRLLHGLVAYLLIPYTVLHALLQWFFGRFWTIFKAQLWWPHVRAGVIGLIVAVPIVTGLYYLDDRTETLTAARLSSDAAAPVLDGDPGDPVWAGAQTVTVRTVKGMNNPGDHVDVAVKAVHDGRYVYFQFQWADPDASFKRFPLVKTTDGWKVLETAFNQSDENVYYEDKLSLYITTVRNGSCASTCHVGEGPHAAKNEKHGLHYTTGGEVGDVWHWKSVRTDPTGLAPGEPGFMDDQHFRARAALPKNPKDRYTGGYFADPDQGGGYAYNFVKVDPSKSLRETAVVPKFLPPTNGIKPDPDPKTSEHGVTWWIHRAAGIPYTKEADTYPLGAMIPNIVVEPLTGDRADVRAKGAWHAGRWTLEARRVLDTGSRYDVPFVMGQPVYITVATYNRTQTRHGEHIKPIRLMLQP